MGYYGTRGHQSATPITAEQWQAEVERLRDFECMGFTFGEVKQYSITYPCIIRPDGRILIEIPEVQYIEFLVNDLLNLENRLRHYRKVSEIKYNGGEPMFPITYKYVCEALRTDRDIDPSEFYEDGEFVYDNDFLIEDFNENIVANIILSLLK